MKINCAALGRKSLEHLRAVSRRADEVQAEFLLDRLSENRDTIFGRRYGFADIDTVQKFRDAVPLSGFEDYSADIERIIRGEKNVLTDRDAVYFCISSGTVGSEKYIPITESDLISHYIYMYGAVFGQIREYYRDYDERGVFGKIFQVGEFARTHMPDGRMNGIRSGCVYQWLESKGKFDASDYCVPKEILFPDTPKDMLYLKVRFALAERDLTAVHGVFVSRVAGVMEYILQNWETLLYDMEHGTVSPPLDADTKKYIAEKLPPNPARARELRNIPKEDLRRGLVKKLWKNMKYILAIGGESFSYYTDKLREYAGDVPIHFFVYAASEGVFGLAERVNAPDRYILLPDSVFFEFIPAEDENAKPLLMSEVKVGNKYELVVTNRSGLYRYHMDDVIEVIGMFEQAPVVKFCYRKNQIINAAGEKSNQQQFDLAVKRFSELTRCEVRGYCVQEDISGIAPRYLFYMECDRLPQNADAVFEKCLCAANAEYGACLNMREIEPLHIEFLREGSFELFEKNLADAGKSMAQCKMPHFLNTKEKKDFFASQVTNKEVKP